MNNKRKLCTQVFIVPDKPVYRQWLAALPKKRWFHRRTSNWWDDYIELHLQPEDALAFKLRFEL